MRNHAGRLSMLAVLMLLAGCAPGLRRAIPPDLTAVDVIGVLGRRAALVRDLTARVSVTIDRAGAEETAVVLTRFIAPDRFRLTVKGFAGIEMARIGINPDSLVAYIPLANTWYVTRRPESLGTFLPGGLAEDPAMLSVLVTGWVSPGDEPFDGATLHRTNGRGAELSFSRGDVRYRFFLEGPELALTGVEIIRDGKPPLTLTFTARRDIDGISVPRVSILTRGSDSLRLEIGDVTVNTGLAPTDLAVPQPSSAERINLDVR